MDSFIPVWTQQDQQTYNTLYSLMVGLKRGHALRYNSFINDQYQDVIKVIHFTCHDQRLKQQYLITVNKYIKLQNIKNSLKAIDRLPNFDNEVSTVKPQKYEEPDEERDDKPEEENNYNEEEPNEEPMNIVETIKTSKSKQKIQPDDNTTEDDKRFKKRRCDILYNCNKLGRIPKKETLEKYGIKFNEYLKKYEI